MPSALPYGSWPSPLSAHAATSSSPRFDGAQFVGSEIWWAQGLPDEGGRTTIMRSHTDGSIEQLLPSPWNARSSVHEYGGGAWAATSDGVLIVSERSDQRLWAFPRAGDPYALTPRDSRTRFGGLDIQQGRLIAIREVHGARGTTPLRAVVEVPIDGSASDHDSFVSVLAEGDDFLAHPALSPDGTHLAWVGWSHPCMPWDETTLRVRELATGVTTRIAGGHRTAPLQPEWLSPHELIYSDDPSGRWNLWRAKLGSSPVALSPVDADTGGGLWVLGTRWFATLSSTRTLAVRTHGADSVVVIDHALGAERTLSLPLTAQISIEDVQGSQALLSGAGAGVGPGIWLIDLDTNQCRPIAGGVAPLSPQWMPQPTAVTFPAPLGEVHAFDYPPRSPEHRGLDGELPPYVVMVHGGPTSHVGGAVSAKIAYFTTRGIGVLDVNYAGSTGYGRAYRERLLGQWGIADADDVAAAAEGLAREGRADPQRIAIAGGSAGGWTVLAALVRSSTFSAGISRYGVGDARTLATDTHDFEARYLDGLIGPLPEFESTYIERSPLTHAQRLSAPLLLFQGTDDAVVPPSQAEAIRDALQAQSIPYAYVLYEGEGHGFRRRDTLIDTMEKELSFLGQVFNFFPPGATPLALSGA